MIEKFGVVINQEMWEVFFIVNKAILKVQRDMKPVI